MIKKGGGAGYSSVCIYVKKMFEVRRIIPTIREKYKSYEEINSYLKFNTLLVMNLHAGYEFHLHAVLTIEITKITFINYSFA